MPRTKTSAVTTASTEAIVRLAGTARAAGRRSRRRLDRLPHVHGDHDARVVEEADRARGHEHDQQPPQPRAGAGVDHVELAEEAGRERDAGQREQRWPRSRGQQRAAGGEAAVVVDLFGVAVRRPESSRDDAEGPEGGDEVGDQVEGHGDRRRAADREERDQDVAEVGDRGVGQQPLDVVLQQGEQVAGDHRGGGDDGEDDPHRVVRRRGSRCRK